jgi:transposase
MEPATVVVGIDVGKAYLDVGEYPSGAPWRVPHDEAGIADLVARWATQPPTWLVLEATGGREAAVVAALATAGLAVVVVNPRQVRHFGPAVGQRAQTERLEASVLARFAAVGRPAPRPLPEAPAQALAA